MKSSLRSRWFFLAIRLAVGAAFLYAGIAKFLDSGSFAESIATFRLIPNEFVTAVALGLPPLEILAGAMLLTGWRVRVAALTILGLTVVFAIAVAQGLARGLAIDCGCFGSGAPSPVKTWLSLARDLLLVVGSFYLYGELLSQRYFAGCESRSSAPHRRARQR